MKEKSVLGEIIYFNNVKGYGFLKLDKSEIVLFIHKDDIVGIVKIGDKVSLKLKKSRFFRATDIKKV